MTADRPADTPTEADLARLFRQATRQARWPGPQCPPADALERLALGTADSDERSRLADHLVECSSCAALVRELRTLAPWAERIEPRPAARWARRWPLALAAVLALLIAAGYLWRIYLWSDLPRSPDGEAVRGAELAVEPAPGASLEQPPSEFRWPAQPGVSDYRVELLDERGERLWQGPWTGTTHSELPPDIAAELAAGTYLWRLAVRGTEPPSSLGPFVFVLSPVPAPTGG